MNLPSIKNIDIKGKTVFVRADLDVPLSEDREQKTENSSQKTVVRRRIEDDTRLQASLPTIKYLLEQDAKVIIAGHLGRPVNKYQISNIKYQSFDRLRIDPEQSRMDQISNKDKKFSLEPIAKWFVQELENGRWRMENSIGRWKIENGKFGEFDGWGLGENLVLLENLRFYEGEEENDSEFAKRLSSLADIYVNDAFAMCHRKHASIVGITKFLPSYAGFHLTKEIEVLSHVLKNPDRPMVVVIGGVKIETKLPLVRKMQELADYVLVGGLVAQEVQLSSIKNLAGVIIAEANEDKTDITEESLLEFKEIISRAKTIVWNGPLGKTQKTEDRRQRTDSERGTWEVANAIVSSNAYKIAGGGDTTEYLKRTGFTDEFDFVSTGGGAMLSFLSGERLPGLKTLIEMRNEK